MKKLHIKCMPILPMAFNDSISYYETLCQLTKKLNETIEQTNKNASDVKNIEDGQALFVPVATQETIGGIRSGEQYPVSEEYNFAHIWVGEDGKGYTIYPVIREASPEHRGLVKVDEEPLNGFEGTIYIDPNTDVIHCKTIIPTASTETFGIIRTGEEPQEGIETPVYLGDHNIAYVKYSIPTATENTPGGIKSQEYNRTGAVCNVHVDENGLATVKVPNFTIGEDITIPVATGTTIGGIKSQEHAVISGTEYPVHVGLTGYASVKVPTSGYTLPQANGTTLGGVKASAKTSAETVEVKIDTETGKLYVPSGGGSYTLPAATTSELGGVKVTATDASKTKLPVSIDRNSIIHAELSAASTSEIGGVKVTATDANKTQLPISIDNSVIHAELGAATTSAFGGFKATDISATSGTEYSVGIKANGTAYVKVPSGGGATVYCHEVLVYKTNETVGSMTSGYVELKYLYYSTSSTQITTYYAMERYATFVGGYAMPDASDTPTYYLFSEYYSHGRPNRSNNETLKFGWINATNNTVGASELTINSSTWSVSDRVTII